MQIIMVKVMCYELWVLWVLWTVLTVSSVLWSLIIGHINVYSNMLENHLPGQPSTTPLPIKNKQTKKSLSLCILPFQNHIFNLHYSAQSFALQWKSFRPPLRNKLFLSWLNMNTAWHTGCTVQSPSFVLRILKGYGQLLDLLWTLIELLIL